MERRRVVDMGASSQSIPNKSRRQEGFPAGKRYFLQVKKKGSRMRKTLWNESSRQELVERLTNLTPDSRPLWGKMDAPRMLAHIGSTFRMAKGELIAAPKNRPFRYPVIKQLIVYWIPFPKGAPTAPELLSRTVMDWNENVDDVRAQIESFTTRDRNGPWGRHPLFGTLTPREWGVLGYRHTNHHFTQFGI
jgi:hypothetical protein